MKVLVVGCGRVGALLAETFDRSGHAVTIIDVQTRAFDRLPGDFTGAAVRGDGTDEDVLRRAGAEDVDLFLALTEGDNRNVMAAQLAREAFSIERTVAKINDPVRARAYAELGVSTICRTTLLTDAVLLFAGLPTSGEPAIHEASEHAHPLEPEPLRHGQPSAVGASTGPTGPGLTGRTGA
jgi:trk system potassium uptake protein TrkA